MLGRGRNAVARALRAAERALAPAPLCQMGADAHVYPEARIDNLRQDASAITIGRFSHVRGRLLVFPHGGRIGIGEYCYIGEHTNIWSGGSVTIGNRVLIAHACNIFDNDTHPMEAAARHTHFKHIITSGHPRSIDLNESAVAINDDAWIACNVTILKGVTIGARAIVAAGSVVVRDVPAGCLAAGNPARVVRPVE